MLGGVGNRVGVHFVRCGSLLVCWWRWRDACTGSCCAALGWVAHPWLQGCGLVASLLCWVEKAVGLLSIGTAGLDDLERSKAVPQGRLHPHVLEWGVPNS